MPVNFYIMNKYPYLRRVNAEYFEQAGEPAFRIWQFTRELLALLSVKKTPESDSMLVALMAKMKTFYSKLQAGVNKQVLKSIIEAVPVVPNCDPASEPDFRCKMYRGAAVALRMKYSGEKALNLLSKMSEFSASEDMAKATDEQKRQLRAIALPFAQFVFQRELNALEINPDPEAAAKFLSNVIAFYGSPLAVEPEDARGQAEFLVSICEGVYKKYPGLVIDLLAASTAKSGVRGLIAMFVLANHANDLPRETRVKVKEALKKVLAKQDLPPEARKLCEAALKEIQE